MGAVPRRLYCLVLPTFEGSPDHTLGYIDLQYNPQAFKLPHSSSQSKFNSLPNIKSRRRSHYISTLENSFYPKSEKLNNLTMEVTPKDTENKTAEPTKDEDTESKTSESTTVVISTSDSVCSDSPRGVTNEAFEDDEEVDNSCKKGHRRSPSTSNIKDEKTCDVSYSSAGSSAIEIPIPVTKEDQKAKELAPEYQLVMPDTQLRKGWRGEKLYFAKGNSDPRADGHVRRFCWWMVCLVLLAGAITVAGLIGVGVIKLPLHLENERIHSYHSGEETGPGPRLGQVRDQDAAPGISSIDTIVLYDYNTRNHEVELPEPEPQPARTTVRTGYPTQTTEIQTTSETTTHKVSQTMHAAEQSSTQQQEFSRASIETEQEKLTIKADQPLTETEQATTQTEHASIETERTFTQTENSIILTEQAVILTEPAITQTEEVSTQSEQVSTQTEETVQTTTITKEESSQTKTTMPEWKITPVETTQILGDQSTELVSVFQSLGVSDIFAADSADLSGITPEPVFISDIIHQTKIEVNEEGSEAAAVTGFQIDIRNGGSSPIILNINKPFFFVIQDLKNNIPLFMGKIVNPTEQDPVSVEEFKRPIVEEGSLVSLNLIPEDNKEKENIVSIRSSAPEDLLDNEEMDAEERAHMKKFPW